MKDNIHICSFTTDTLFDKKVYGYIGLDVTFHEKGTRPIFATADDLVISVCDFDIPDCERTFLSFLRKFSCKHHHVFCIGTREKLRMTVQKLKSVPSFVQSYTVVSKDADFSYDEVSGLVLNYITPACCITSPSSFDTYSCIKGPVIINGYDNLNEQELRSVMTSLPLDNNDVMVSVIGKSTALLTSTIDKYFPNTRFFISEDRTHNFERIIFISPSKKKIKS